MLESTSFLDERRINIHHSFLPGFKGALDTVESLANRGRDIERRVLTRAVRYHLENRIHLNGHTTAVFTD